MNAMPEGPVPPALLAIADSILDSLVYANRMVPKTTPDIVELLLTADPQMVDLEAYLAMLLATALQRLAT